MTCDGQNHTVPTGWQCEPPPPPDPPPPPSCNTAACFRGDSGDGKLRPCLIPNTFTISNSAAHTPWPGGPTFPSLNGVYNVVPLTTDPDGCTTVVRINGPGANDYAEITFRLNESTLQPQSTITYNWGRFPAPDCQQTLTYQTAHSIGAPCPTVDFVAPQTLQADGCGGTFPNPNPVLTINYSNPSTFTGWLTWSVNPAAIEAWVIEDCNRDGGETRRIDLDLSGGNSGIIGINALCCYELFHRTAGGTSSTQCKTCTCICEGDFRPDASVNIVGPNAGWCNGVAYPGDPQCPGIDGTYVVVCGSDQTWEDLTLGPCTPPGQFPGATLASRVNISYQPAAPQFGFPFDFIRVTVSSGWSPFNSNFYFTDQIFEDFFEFRNGCDPPVYVGRTWLQQNQQETCELSGVVVTIT